MTEPRSRLRSICDRFFAPAAAICLGLMMLITFVEVVARYFLSAPLTGGEEVKSFLLGFTVFTALPLVTRGERHIAVRSVAAMLTGRARLVQQRIVQAGTFVGFAFVTYLLLDQAGALWSAGTITDFLDVPVAPAVYAFAVLAAGAAAMALERLLRRNDAGSEDLAQGPE